MRPARAVPVRLTFAVGVALLLLGCRDDAVSPRVTGPTYAVSDGAHDGNPDFFFLPPLFKNPSNDPDFNANAFNATLRPAVEICELGPEAADGSRECVGGPAVKRFAPEVVTVHPGDEHYQANWNTGETVLDVTKFYRIRVLVGTELLGFADVDPVSSGRDLKSAETGEYIGLVDGRTLPIKFRIENRALCGSPESPCTTETINLETGGGITLTTETETFQFDIPEETEATFGGQPVTDITFTLETCEGIAVDLPVFGDCLRVTTFFTVEGATGAELVLSRAARLSVCVLEPDLSEGQEGFVTLHQQDGALVRALPHVTPNCETISALPAGWRGLAVRGWRWARNLAVRAVTPQMLYARSRTAAFNLGGGGETDRFGSTCDGGAASGPASVARPMLVDCPPSSAPMMAATAIRAGSQTVSDFQFALPAKMDYFNPDDASRTAAPGTALATAVKVTDWTDEPVQGAIVTFTATTVDGAIDLGSVPSNSDGVAEISWTIALGANTLIASGRGIAAQNNYPGGVVQPFMPDISLEPVDQQAVALGLGRVAFSATGEVPPPVSGLDQQNLLDGSIGGQGIGRFSDIDGTPDPDGTSFDFQDAQTFTVGISGRLSQIKVPLVNLSGAEAGVTMQIVGVVDGVPDEGQSLGEVTIPSTAIPTDFAVIGNPAMWATFDLTSLELEVVQGQVLAFIVRSLSTSAYLYNPEFTLGYPNGIGYRRNRALTAAWSGSDGDFGFQTFVDRGP